MTNNLTISKEDLNKIKEIQKRDGNLAPFSITRISDAALKAFNTNNEGGQKEADYIAKRVFKDLIRIKKVSNIDKFIPTVEMIQDLVEEELILEDFVKTAKAYILYRDKKAEERKQHGIIRPEVSKVFKDNSKYFANPYSEFIFYQMYSEYGLAKYLLLSLNTLLTSGLIIPCCFLSS